MALQIIAKGKVKRVLHDGPTLTFRYLLNAGDGKLYVLGAWAEPYIGKHIVISYEEPEEESVGLMEKLAGSMSRALAPA